MKIFIAIILILLALFGFIGISSPDHPAADPLGSIIGFLVLFALPGVLLLVSDIRSRMTKTTPRKGQILLGFGLVVSVFGMALAIHMMTIPKPVIAKNAPAEITKMENGLNNDELFRDGLVAYQKKPLHIRVVYRKKIKAVNNYWYGSDAAFAMDGKGSILGKPGKVEKSCGNTITQAGNRVSKSDPRPYFEATVQLKPADLHRTFNVKATMDVAYPRDKGRGFVNANDRLEERFTVFVVTPAELLQSERFHDYQERNAAAGGFVIFGLCGLGLVGFVIYRRRNGWA
jgi:hypothetical protein